MRTRDEMIKIFVRPPSDTVDGAQQIASLINGCFILLLDIRDLLTKKEDNNN